MITNARDSAGERRSNKRWAVLESRTYNVICPWCSKTSRLPNLTRVRKLRKKVPLAALLCPHCQSVWQYRGTLPDQVSCPVCSEMYSPQDANIPQKQKGRFICPSCGNNDKIIHAIRKLPQDQLWPTKPYAIEGYCPECAGDIERLDLHGNLTKQKDKISHLCNINNNNGKFFKRITPADLKKYQGAVRKWEAEKDRLPYPKSEIPVGEKTKSGLIAHHYIYWHQMFNPRQLLCLSTLLKTIAEEEDQTLKEMLLSGFYSTLESNNTFCRYTISGGNKSQGEHYQFVNKSS